MPFSQFRPRWLHILLAILLSAFCVPASANNKTILVFGDSLSAGHGLERGEEWPSLMQQHLLRQNLPYLIENHSISGETTSGGLSRFQQSLEQSQPNIVILELGDNDGLRGLSLKSMKIRLQKMIDMATARDAQVILVGMRLPTNYGPAYTELFHSQFKKLADSNGIKFVPFLMGGLDIGLKMYQADGLHPTAKAQPAIMHNVWQVLETVIKQ